VVGNVLAMTMMGRAGVLEHPLSLSRASERADGGQAGQWCADVFFESYGGLRLPANAGLEAVPRNWPMRPEGVAAALRATRLGSVKPVEAA